MADLSILNTEATTAAKRLLGCELVRELNGQKIVVKIVETEAYDQTDVASHSYRGLTPRTEVMFGEPGYLYVYFTYGMHYCCNVVVGPPGYGAAVLLRGAEILEGEEEIKKLRNHQSGINLTNGPAKLCQGLSIDKNLNGHYLRKEPLKLIINPALKPSQVETSERIGISKAKDLKWRFFVKDNQYVSK
jgi:DNA-3-methyladenine glycosylase